MSAFKAMFIFFVNPVRCTLIPVIKSNKNIELNRVGANFKAKKYRRIDDSNIFISNFLFIALV